MVNTLCSRMYSVGSNPAEHMFYWVALTFHPLSPIFAGHSSNNSEGIKFIKADLQSLLPAKAAPSHTGKATYPRYARTPGTGCTTQVSLFSPIFPHFPPFFPHFPHFLPFSPIFLAMGTLWVRLRVHYPPPEPGTSEPCNVAVPINKVEGRLRGANTCTTGAQHRTLKERPILSGYRWQF